jgi:hypothetical protein
MAVHISCGNVNAKTMMIAVTTMTINSSFIVGCTCSLAHCDLLGKRGVIFAKVKAAAR